MLVTAAPGYLLAVEPDVVDAQVFARPAEEGRAALGAGTPGSTTPACPSAS